MTSDAATQTQAPPQPHPDLQGLDRLIGTWKVFDPTSAGGAEGQVSYRWMEGGFFLLQDIDLVNSGHVVKGLEIIGHEQPFGAEPSADIKSRYYGTAGETFDYVYESDDTTLTIWGGERGSPAYYKGTFSADGNTLAGEWVYPGGGGYQSTMTRVQGP
jgi:hypothetical protein